MKLTSGERVPMKLAERGIRSSAQGHLRVDNGVSESRPNFKRKKDIAGPSRLALFSPSRSNCPIEIRSSESRRGRQECVRHDDHRAAAVRSNL